MIENQISKITEFTEKDVEEAIKGFNFIKGICKDQFSGKIFDKSPVVRTVQTLGEDVLNGERPIPAYLSQGRLIVLSKRASSTPN